MRKIIIFRNCFSGGVSGGDTHIGGIAKWMVQSENEEVYLVHPKNDGQENFYPEVKLLKGITYRPPFVNSHFAVSFLARSIWACFLRLPGAEQKVLIAGSHFLPDVLPIAVKKMFQPKLEAIIYVHHIVQDMPRKKNLNNMLAFVQEKICFLLIKRYFNKIIVISDSVKNNLISRGFKAGKIYVSTNFIPQTGGLVQPLNDKSIDLVFCGRLVRQKGVYDFLWIVERLKDEGFKLNAVMMGTGPEYKKLETMITESGSNVKLTGYVSERVKAKTLASAKYLIFPSIEEGWGIVVAESLSLGTKVIAYDIPAYTNVFDSYIDLVSLGERERLLKTVRSMLSGEHPGDYAQWQSRASRAMEQYSMPTVARSEYKYIVKNA